MQHILDAIMAAEGAGRPGRGAGRHRRRCRCRRATAAWSCAPTRPRMFDGLATRDKDPRKSLHVQEVPTPELGPGRGAGRGDGQRDQLQHGVDVASSSRCRRSRSCSGTAGSPTLTKRHDLPYHVVGSDAAGVVLRVGAGVTKWKPGDEVVAHCLSVELEDAAGHDDTMLDPQQRIWGFETNFGGLAELALVKANQLMPKPRPPHLGGGGQPRAGQLHRVPAARLAPRRQHEAGRRRADLGRLRRPRLRTPPSSRSTAARSRSAWSPARRRRSCAGGWAPSWSSTGPPRATSSGRTSTPRTRPSGSGSARGSAS